MHQVEIATTKETLLDSPEMVLNMGPQHPSTHGVLRVVLRLDGETVIDLDCDIGFLHRGMEKIAENRLYPMIAPYWDRLDYISAVSNGLLWVETVEQMMGLEVPPRAHYVRTILTELNRISSHLLWLATHALDIGAFTVLLWSLRGRDSKDFRTTVRRTVDLSRLANWRHAKRHLRGIRIGHSPIHQQLSKTN